MEIEKILVPVISGAFGLATFLFGQKFQKSKLKQSLVDSLKAELSSNKKAISRSIKANAKVIAGHEVAGQGLDVALTIDDETNIYVTSLIDTPLANWTAQEVQTLIPKFPIAALIDYKLALYRANYLVQRHMNFRYRIHFLGSFIKALEETQKEIERLEERLQEVGL